MEPIIIHDETASDVAQEFVRTQTDIKIDGYSASGMNGDVYFGERHILKDRVALKFYSYDPKISTHKEPLILKEIKHKNIIEIYDARIIKNNFAYFLTPQISGGDLQSYLDKKIISTQLSINIIQGVLQGITELHKQPNCLLHRDLKPDNILIDEQNFEPYIADFGSIVKLSNSADFVTTSKNNFFYQPYEAIKNKEYRIQSDIY